MQQLKNWLQQFKTDINEQNIQQIWFMYKPFLLGIFVVFLTMLGLVVYASNQLFVTQQVDIDDMFSESKPHQMMDSHQDLELIEEGAATTDSVAMSSQVNEETIASTSISTSETWYVDIKGAVKTPKVVPVSSGMRVHDVIEMAGGLTAEADQSQVNLAQLVTDQMVVYVPKVGEEINPSTKTLVMDSQMTESNIDNQETAQSELVNINTADATALQTLSGIGEKRATDIIAYREANGPFSRIEDLEQVSGIGEKTLEKLKPFITVN